MLSQNRNLQPRNNMGFSLVEIMVALVLGLFILGGAITVLLQNQQNYRHNDDFGRLQENARFALELLTSDLRRAGYYGCSNTINPQFTPPAASTLLDLIFPIDGMEQDTGLWAALGDSDIADQVVGGTDAITIRGLRGGGIPISADMTALDSVIQMPSVPVNAGELAAIYDCETTDVFQPTAVTPTTLTHAGVSRIFKQTAAYLANPAADGFNANTFVARFDAARYFIGQNPVTGIRGLWRQHFDGANIGTQELIEGVENMQIYYGINSDLTGGPDSYATADAVGDWSQVVGVKLILLVSTLEDFGTDGVDAKTYDIYGTPDNSADDIGPFNDRRTRKLVSATVSLRNMQPKLNSI